MSGTVSNSTSLSTVPTSATVSNITAFNSTTTALHLTTTALNSTTTAHMSRTSVKTVAPSIANGISDSSNVISTSKSLATFATKNSTQDEITTEASVTSTNATQSESATSNTAQSESATSKTATTEKIISAHTSTSEHPSSVSKVTSVVTEHGPILSMTTTVTNPPSSTFSTPVPITVVDPSNGKSSLSTPPVITVFSTSAESDGSFVTVTNVIANPTGFIGGDPPGPGPRPPHPTSFLNDGGKVAGVFVVVGIVAATISLFACLAFRRRRKRTMHRRRWLAGIQRPLPLPPNPFEDPREPPMMQVSFHNHAQESQDWDQHRDDKVEKGTSPQDGTTTGLGLTGLEVQKFVEGPFSDIYACDADQVGIAISTSPDLGQSRRSLAQSSPSLYPPTLPDDESVHEDTNMGQRSVEIPPPSSSKSPPRPPRSHLRSPVVKNVELYPLTPPASVSSHEHSPVSKPPSPELSKSPSAFATGSTIRSRTSQDDILARPTLLDVRHKPSIE